MFHPFTDKTTPLLLIKHFCAQTSKPILFTLNLTPNKGKWVNHFEVTCNVLFTLFCSRDTLQWRLLNPVYSDGKNRLVCAAQGSVLMFNWDSAAVGCDKAHKRTRTSGVQLTNASEAQVQSPRGTSKQRHFRNSHSVLLPIDNKHQALESRQREQRYVVLHLHTEGQTNYNFRDSCFLKREHGV